VQICTVLCGSVQTTETMEFSEKLGSACQVFFDGLYIYPLLIVLLVFQTATVIDVSAELRVTLALQLGDTSYTAEFPPRALKPHSFRESTS